jgi:formylmethanofuran dehydrogenase subunit A
MGLGFYLFIHETKKVVITVNERYPDNPFERLCKVIVEYMAEKLK